MSNSYEQELITSPMGEVQFASLHRKTLKTFGDKEKAAKLREDVESAKAAGNISLATTLAEQLEKMYEYVIRVHYDGTSEAAQEFKNKISGLNSRCIGTQNAKNKGDFTLKASTQFQPKIFAPDGEELTGDDVPRFSKDSTAKVTMTVKPYTGKMGVGIKLIAVQFHELNIVESSGGEEARQNTMNKLRESLSAAAKL